MGAEVPDGGGADSAWSLPPLAYSLILAYAERDPSFPYPNTIDGHLFLEIDEDGAVTGTISATDGDAASRPVSLVPLAGRVEGEEIVLEGDAVPVAPGGELGLAELRFAPCDADGDGAVESAHGRSRS